MVQYYQAAAGRERLKQLIVASALRSRLNLCVCCFGFILGQVAYSEMKQVPLKPKRQFFANGDTPVQIGTRTPQSDVSGEFVVIGDRQMNSVEPPLGRGRCLHV